MPTRRSCRTISLCRADTPLVHEHDLLRGPHGRAREVDEALLVLEKRRESPRALARRIREDLHQVVAIEPGFGESRIGRRSAARCAQLVVELVLERMVLDVAREAGATAVAA